MCVCFGCWRTYLCVFLVLVSLFVCDLCWCVCVCVCVECRFVYVWCLCMCVCVLSFDVCVWSCGVFL